LLRGADQRPVGVDWTSPRAEGGAAIVAAA